MKISEFKPLDSFRVDCCGTKEECDAIYASDLYEEYDIMQKYVIEDWYNECKEENEGLEKIFKKIIKIYTIKSFIIYEYVNSKDMIEAYSEKIKEYIRINAPGDQNYVDEIFADKFTEEDYKMLDNMLKYILMKGEEIHFALKGEKVEIDFE